MIHAQIHGIGLGSTPLTKVTVGPYGCIGRPLALLELRTLIANLVMRFDISLAPGEDGRSLLDQTRDQFTTMSGNLLLVFNMR